ncbi:MAG: tRNA (N6-isopentenyl adenosine(37)-C2)-methylthiotransferase MiaB, partial [Kocuria sp.]|nr:tRNA (N6-isopentenyl adenosine(37)-C2)-methylthiotransferase MiaB [Kocuria sp.]
IRPGTPAGEMANQVPHHIVQERFERLTALQDRISARLNQQLVGSTVEVLISAHQGRKSESTHRLSGRSQDQRLVHFSVPDGAEAPRPGDFVTVPVTAAAAYHLLADPQDASEYSLRRSRGGDAWEAAQAESCGTGSSGKPGAVGLGMPTLRTN